ncbi:hypothetical protein [Methanoculleus sp.]|uniref:hypothetical protein n=1 Tax=Methanoculleus sp. TaxID=90427 RepID=UPI0025EB9066|nr:hypothetical protein [Methanoculleus sp.]
MNRTTSRATRCAAGPSGPKPDRMALLQEIARFTREHADILARYHLHTMADLNRIEEECRRLHNEACSRGACGSAGELVELEYLIGRAKEMKAKRTESERGPG